ncbi:hypothetical protein [Cryobacterium sp. HLT2-28]|uniref:hypothetical protein n=1 Tax=Cryobacterium sp. HLT2-28 TaxID=1259146 RepID=UPI00106CC76F|nr:hypothetical protein [Cryobacterium sp. HLT2-28]TFB92786.1 hypothetical protein E3O48_13570 [Cryobacterium sp. HLT2-28]
MALTKYLINKDVPVNEAFKRTVKADSYRFADGYFHFYANNGTDDVKVFSIGTSQVQVIEVIEN